MSKTPIKKATKLDMDDRAKMLHYFHKTNDETNVTIEELFTSSWQLPHLGPRVPSIITVSAPAGIGKSSMLKYMCLKCGLRDLWLDNFDVLIFIECRTLNHLGPMTGREFVVKHMESVAEKMEPGTDLMEEVRHKAAVGRLLFLLDGLDEITGVASLVNLPAKYSQADELSPLELTQAILCGRLLPGSHVIVTSRQDTTAGKCATKQTS